jgi:hypothetical protein
LLDARVASVREQLCHPLGKRRNHPTPLGTGSRQLVRKRGKDAADASPCLTEIELPEGARPREVEDVPVHDRSAGFDQVEHERVARAVIGVNDL